MGFFDPAQGFRAGERQDLRPGVSACRIFLLTLMLSHRARVARLLGTSCCLVASQEEGLAVSEPQPAASPARGPEFLAGARCCLAAAWATSLEWRLHRPAAPGRPPRLLPGVGPSPGGWTLCSSGKHKADVVDLNRFLMRLSPLLAPGWASSAGNPDCISTTTRNHPRMGDRRA